MFKTFFFRIENKEKTECVSSTWAVQMEASSQEPSTPYIYTTLCARRRAANGMQYSSNRGAVVQSKTDYSVQKLSTCLLHPRLARRGQYYVVASASPSLDISTYHAPRERQLVPIPVLSPLPLCCGWPCGFCCQSIPERVGLRGWSGLVWFDSRAQGRFGPGNRLRWILEPQIAFGMGVPIYGFVRVEVAIDVAIYRMPAMRVP